MHQRSLRPFLVLFFLLWGPSAFAVTFTVNNAGDADDAVAGDGLCATAGAVCTLRAALTEAAALASADTINFSGAGCATLTPATSYPNLSGDGDSVLNADPANCVVTLDGKNDGDAFPIGLHVSLGIKNNTIHGLVIINFASAGITVNGTDTVITGNYIGVESDGVTAAGNSIGIDAGVGTIIGGTTAADRNVISGNKAFVPTSGIGIAVSATVGASAAKIFGNTIGWGADGVTPVPNARPGIYLASAGSLVGGTTVAERNYILSNNDSEGVTLDTAAATGNIVEGNYFGIDIEGKATSFGSDDSQGVLINLASGNTVQNNYFGLPKGLSVEVSGGDTNTITGNWIGMIPTGSASDGSAAAQCISTRATGIDVDASATAIVKNNYMGGFGGGSGNQYAIHLINGTTGATVQGNCIGGIPLNQGETTVCAVGTDCTNDYGVQILSGSNKNTVKENEFGSQLFAGLLITTNQNTISGNTIGLLNGETAALGGGSPTQNGGYLASNSCYAFGGSNYCDTGPGGGKGNVVIDGTCAHSVAVNNSSASFVFGGDETFALVLSSVGGFKVSYLIDTQIAGLNLASPSSIQNCLSATTGGNAPPAAFVIDQQENSWIVGQGANADFSFPSGLSTTNAVDGITVAVLDGIEPNPGLQFYSAQAVLGSGILIVGGDDNEIIGNIIQNATTGIFLITGATGNIIGNGPAGKIDASKANIVTGNTVGVQIGSSHSLDNTIRGNQITQNSGSAIVLNDGSNKGIASPTIEFATFTSMEGSCVAASTLDIFSDTTNQGANYIDSATCDAKGRYLFTSLPAGTFNLGKVVTLVQTDGDGNTSSFSGAFDPNIVQALGGGCSLGTRKTAPVSFLIVAFLPLLLIIARTCQKNRRYSC